MEKGTKKLKTPPKNNEPSSEHSMSPPSKENEDQKSSPSEATKGNETSDEDEVVNYPNQPPIQNGFVVFIHQSNLATNVKEKRTVVEWISDALKLLDIHPEIITVDKMMEQSITHVQNSKSNSPSSLAPIITFSKPTPPNKQNEDVNVPSFRFRTKNHDDHSTRSEFISDNGSSSSKAPYNNNNNNNNRTRIIQSRKKLKYEKTKSVSHGITNQNSMNPTSWKGAKITPQKSLNSTTSKPLQRKPNGRNVKPLEDKKQECGVQLAILRQKCRTMQMENSTHVWVLLIESRRRCIVDMGKLNSLATSYRFKVRWIAAQAPRSLDQSVFAVVNDIVQTKNICFPEQMKASRHKDAKMDGKSSGPPGSGVGSQNKGGKSLAVEILHKTLSAQFDVSSYASFDITQLMKVAGSDAQPQPETEPEIEEESAPPSATNENEDTELGEEEGEVQDKNSKNGHTTDSYESVTSTTKSSDASSLFEIKSTNKNYTTLYNTAVQIALTSQNNPFDPSQSPYMKTDGFMNFPSNEKKTQVKRSMRSDVNGNELEENLIVPKSLIVIIRDLTNSGRSLTKLLLNLLKREGLLCYTISISHLLIQPKAIELMEQFAINCGYDASRDLTMGYKILIENDLKFKLNEGKFQIIIVDVEDESFVRMWSIYKFCTKLGYKPLVLEEKKDGSVDPKLKKILKIIRQTFKHNSSSLRHITTSISSGQLQEKKLKNLKRDKSSACVDSENYMEATKLIQNEQENYLKSLEVNNNYNYLNHLNNYHQSKRSKSSFSWLTLNEDEDDHLHQETLPEGVPNLGEELLTIKSNCDVNCNHVIEPKSGESSEESSLPTDFKSKSTGIRELVDETEDEEEDELIEGSRTKSSQLLNLSKLRLSKNLPISDVTSNEDEDSEEIRVELIGSRASYRKNLLEIHRYKSRDDDTTVTVSSASLFKGWVAYPHADSVNIKQKPRGCFGRTQSKVGGFFKKVCLCSRKEESKLGVNSNSSDPSIALHMRRITKSRQGQGQRGHGPRRDSE